MAVTIYKPYGLDSSDHLVIDDQLNPANNKEDRHPHARQIFVNTDPNKVHFGYANLSNYLNFRSSRINDDVPLLDNDDLIVIDRLPVTAYFLDVRFYLFKEKIVNYNASTNQTFKLATGFCEPGGDVLVSNMNSSNGGDNWPIGHRDLDMLNLVTKCEYPQRFWDAAGINYFYNYTLPVRSWLPSDYAYNEADFALRVQNKHADLNSAWQMHIWYSYAVV